MHMKTSDIADTSIMPFPLMLCKVKWGPEPWNNGEQKKPSIMPLLSHLRGTSLDVMQVQTSI